VVFRYQHLHGCSDVSSSRTKSPSPQTPPPGKVRTSIIFLIGSIMTFTSRASSGLPLSLHLLSQR
ncbi:hypothetical protein ACJ73_08867, partial [Blastomyces percursus]